MLSPLVAAIVRRQSKEFEDICTIDIFGQLLNELLLRLGQLHELVNHTYLEYFAEENLVQLVHVLLLLVLCWNYG